MQPTMYDETRISATAGVVRRTRQDEEIAPELNLLAETETTTGTTPAIAYEYVWFAGQPVAQIATATSEVSWYFNDHLGTPVLQTSSTGAVVWRVEREPYGKIFSTRVGAGRHQPLSFPGQEDDGSSDRSYNIFRWYRSGWGRFTQSDPAFDGYYFDVGLYTYAGANPITNFDPDGQRYYPPPAGGAVFNRTKCPITVYGSSGPFSKDTLMTVPAASSFGPLTRSGTSPYFGDIDFICLDKRWIKIRSRVWVDKGRVFGWSRPANASETAALPPCTDGPCKECP